MKKLLIFFIIVTAVSAIAIEKLFDTEWQTFKVQHKKSYETDIEESFRKKIFMQNRYKITVHNKKFELGLVTYELGMNQFGDMLNSEFVDIMNRFNRTTQYVGNSETDSDAVTFISPENIQFPEDIDWRNKRAVTPVKNQGRCGSCWAFSAVGSIEGQNFRKTNKLVSLSEQNLLDCATQNHGCEGGRTDYAFTYVGENGGIDTEETYPYKAKQKTCRYDPSNSGATVTGYVEIESESEEELRQAVATVGPVSVAVDASNFQLYKRGIFYDPDCSSTQLNHAVLVVGYGTDADTGKNYWTVKNSWGGSWGDGGYILMSRNRNNNCGIASFALYPLV